jgi:hypothetical protein
MQVDAHRERSANPGQLLAGEQGDDPLAADL